MASTTRRTAYRYRRIGGYEAAYEALTRYGAPVGEVERIEPDHWVAELHDGRRGFGRTRDAAVRDAKGVGR